MNVVFGLYRPDAGSVLVRGEEIECQGVQDAIAHGIGMVHQHFQLIPVFTVAENVVLGSELDQEPAARHEPRPAARSARSAHRYGLDVDPDAKVGDLSVGEQQRVELVKALFRRGRHPDPRRAHGGAHPGRGRRLLRRRAQPRRPGQVDRLHHPQAARGARRRRPDHGPAQRPRRRHRRSRNRDPAVAGQPHGRPRRRVPRREASAAARATCCCRCAVCACSTTAACRPSTASRADVRGGEVFGIAGVEGNGQRELVEAITGMRRKSRRARADPRPRRHRRCPRARSPSSAPPTSPRTGASTGWSAGTRSPTTSSSTASARPRSPGGASAAPTPWRRRPAGSSPSSTSARPASTSPSARCRAATSRR